MPCTRAIPPVTTSPALAVRAGASGRQRPAEAGLTWLLMLICLCGLVADAARQVPMLPAREPVLLRVLFPVTGGKSREAGLAVLRAPAPCKGPAPLPAAIPSLPPVPEYAALPAPCPAATQSPGRSGWLRPAARAPPR